MFALMTTLHTCPGSKLRRKSREPDSDVSTGAEELIDDVKIEGKVQSPVPMEDDSLLHKTEELASPTSAALSSVRSYQESSRLSLQIAKRASLPAIPTDLHTAIEMGL